MIRVSPGYPQSNGKLERYHRTLKEEEIRPRAPRTEAKLAGRAGEIFAMVCTTSKTLDVDHFHGGSASTSPLVSIGMPVYNEGEFLRQALDSLLSQDFPGFELIISDNASQDTTWEVCHEYAVRDSRIQCYRNKTNVGAVENFNRTFRLASGRYFMWAAGHDLWDRRYISRCLAALENDPRIALCYAQVGVIDGNNDLIETVREGIAARSPGAFDRFRETLWGLARIPYTDPIYGLIRSTALRRTRLAQNVWGTDNVILLELALAGAIVQVKERLYYRRMNRDRTANVESWTDRYLEALDPTNSRKRIQLTWSHMCVGYMGVVHRGPFRTTQKLILVTDIWRSVLKRAWRGLLFHDVICGAIRLTFGHRAALAFKKRIYRMAKRLGVYI